MIDASKAHVPGSNNAPLKLVVYTYNVLLKPHRQEAYRRPCVEYKRLSLLPPLLALLENTKTSITLANTNKSTDQRVPGDLVESVLVRFDRPSGRIQLRPVDLARLMSARCICQCTLTLIGLHIEFHTST